MSARRDDPRLGTPTVVISLLIVLGLLIISLVPVAPVAAADGCWRGTVISGEAHFTLLLLDARGRSLGLTNRDIGRSITLSAAPARLGIRIQHSGAIKWDVRSVGARRYFEDGEDTDYNDLVLEVNDTCPPRPPYNPPSVSTGTGSTDSGRSRHTASTSDLATATPTATPTPSGPLAHVGVGWMAADGSEIVPVGFVRDASGDQTYAVVRRALDGKVVRYWVAPDSALALVVPWEEVKSNFTYSVDVIITIPLDDQYPQPDQVARRFDGGDERIFSYDYGMDFWRQVPDTATFQVLGFYWCDVTAADATFWERVTIGVPHPPTSLPEQADYPNCQPTD